MSPYIHTQRKLETYQLTTPRTQEVGILSHAQTAVQSDDEKLPEAPSKNLEEEQLRLGDHLPPATD